MSTKTLRPESKRLRLATHAQRRSWKAAGMTEISMAELSRMVTAIGYKIDPSMCCNGVSKCLTGPDAGRQYHYRSIGYKHVATGLCFANVNAPKDTLPQLQEIRRNYFVFSAGRICS